MEGQDYPYGRIYVSEEFDRRVARRTLRIVSAAYTVLGLSWSCAQTIVDGAPSLGMAMFTFGCLVGALVTEVRYRRKIDALAKQAVIERLRS